MPVSKRKQVAQMLPFSPWMLAGIVVVVLILAIYLIPSEKRMVQKYIADQDWDKAYAALLALPKSEREKQAHYYDHQEIRLRRLRLDPADIEAHAALLPDAIEAAAKHKFTPEFQVEIDQLLERVPGTVATFQLLEPHLAKFPVETHDALRVKFAMRAVADDNAKLGLEIYTPYWARHKNDQAVMERYIQIAGWAQRMDLAIRALEEYEAQLTEPLHVHNRKLALDKVDLLLATEQQMRAYQMMKVVYDNADEETKALLFPKYQQIAQWVQQGRDLLPAVIAHAKQHPDDPNAWRKLAQMARSQDDQKLEINALRRVVVLASQDGVSAFRLGNLLQWNNQPNEAFNAYLHAMQRGANEAVEAVVTLNRQGLFRDVELFNAMEAMGGRLDRKKYGLAMARLAANLSDFKKASAYYEEILKREGENPDILNEYGLMMLDLGHHEEAIAIYSRASAVGKTKFKVLVSIAEAQFRAGKYEEALKTYRDLLRMKPHRRQLENYLRLAESMGRIEEAADILWAFMQNSGEAERKDYEKQAYYNGVLGRSAALETTLREAFKKFPEDPTIRKQLLYAYSDNKKHAQAADLLATFPDLRDDKELSKFYIDLLVTAKRYRDVEKFISELPAGTADKWELNELLVGVYYQTGNKEAIFRHYGKLYESNPGNSKWALTYAQLLLDRKRNQEAKRIVSSITGEGQPQAYKIAAQLHAADRDFKLAERYQRQYLASNPKDSGRDWGFMGDILGERGDKTGAQRSYRRAISEMLDTMANIANTNAPAANASVN